MKNSQKNNKITGTIILIISIIFFYFKYQEFSNNNLLIWVSLIVANLVLIFIYPKIFTFFNYFLIKLGFALSKIVNPIFYFIIFYFLITPTGIYYRLKYRNNDNSSWKVSKNNKFQNKDFFDNEY